MKDEAPIAAATLIVMRDGPTAPELLMVERAAGLRFAGGAVAFPGGRIEPVDYASANHSLDAAKVAAIRETAEETGILIAAEPRPCEQAMFEIGVELRAGRSLSAILAERNVRLAIATLVPFARWCPVGLEKRPFDTHFFLARAPEALPLPIADGSEISRVFWTSAKALLDGADQGRRGGGGNRRKAPAHVGADKNRGGFRSAERTRGNTQGVTVRWKALVE